MEFFLFFLVVFGRQGALWEMCDSRIDLFTCMFCVAKWRMRDNTLENCFFYIRLISMHMYA